MQFPRYPADSLLAEEPTSFRAIPAIDVGCKQMVLLITLGLAKKGNTRVEPFGFKLKSLIYDVGD
jgi:hypothetical protein